MKRGYMDYEQHQNHHHVQAHLPSGESPPQRSCLQCGATKTPQWREGPLGPKTLCNACGVKRVRQIKAQMEGRKPHNVTVGKRAPPQHTIHYAANRVESAQVATALQLLASCAHHPALTTAGAEPEQPQAPKQQPTRSSSRPLRPAAARALQRVTEYDAEAGADLEAAAGAAAPVSVQAAAKGSGNGESNMPTDSGEEISWTPRHSPLPVKQDPSTEDLSELEADAAANLLSMSFAARPTTAPTTPSSSPLVAPVRGPRSSNMKRAPPALTLTATAAAMAAAAAAAATLDYTLPPPAKKQAVASSSGPWRGRSPAVGGYQVVQYDAPRAGCGSSRALAAVDTAHLLGPGLGWLEEVLPEARFKEVLGMKREVEQHHQELKAAEAAVEAVAKILKEKQEAAHRARSLSDVASRQLMASMGKLNAEFQLAARLAQKAAEGEGKAMADGSTSSQEGSAGMGGMARSSGQSPVGSAEGSPERLGRQATPGSMGSGQPEEQGGVEDMEVGGSEGEQTHVVRHGMQGLPAGLPPVASLAAIAAAALAAAAAARGPVAL